MYSQDSFFDLSQWGRVGLLCISTFLFLTVFAFTMKLLVKKPVWLKISGALFVFWLFVWVSPQIYYMYYRSIIDDLPLQWVIWPVESPKIALDYLIFQGPQNLSAHSQGLMGWALIAAPFMPKRWLKRIKLS